MWAAAVAMRSIHSLPRNHRLNQAVRPHWQRPQMYPPAVQPHYRYSAAWHRRHHAPSKIHRCHRWDRDQVVSVRCAIDLKTESPAALHGSKFSIRHIFFKFFPLTFLFALFLKPNVYNLSLFDLGVNELIQSLFFSPSRFSRNLFNLCFVDFVVLFSASCNVCRYRIDLHDVLCIEQQTQSANPMLELFDCSFFWVWVSSVSVWCQFSYKCPKTVFRICLLWTAWR